MDNYKENKHECYSFCCYCGNFKEKHYFISPLLILFPFKCSRRRPFEDKEFDQWMQLQYPDKKDRLVQNYEFTCCMVKRNYQP